MTTNLCQCEVTHRKSCVVLPTIVVDNSCVVGNIVQVAIASQLLVVRSRKVANVRSTNEMHAFYFEQLLIVNSSQLKLLVCERCNERVATLAL